MNERRLEAVRLRLSGLSVEEAAHRTNLSTATVISAMKAYRRGGWTAVPVAARGRGIRKQPDPNIKTFCFGAHGAQCPGSSNGSSSPSPGEALVAGTPSPEKSRAKERIFSFRSAQHLAPEEAASRVLALLRRMAFIETR